MRLDCYVICDNKTLKVYLLAIWVNASWLLCPHQFMQPHNLLSKAEVERK